MDVTLHNLKSVKADCTPASSPLGWLKMTDRDENEVCVFMDYLLAEALEEAWHAYHDEEPEMPTYDEALATKSDAGAREWEARKLKGMV